MEETVSVYRQGDKYFLHPLLYTTLGVPCFSEPVIVVFVSEPLETLGKTVVSLRKYAKKIPHPSDWNPAHIIKPFLRAANAASWKEFVSTARYIEIDCKKNAYSFTPTIAANTELGFDYYYPKAKKIVTDDANEIGKTLADLFNRFAG